MISLSIFDRMSSKMSDTPTITFSNSKKKLAPPKIPSVIRKLDKGILDADYSLE